MKVRLPIPIFTILVQYFLISLWMHCIFRTSGVKGPLAFFTRVIPHPVSIRDST